MKILFIGCVNFSKIFLEHLLTMDSVYVVGIISKSSSPQNTDFISLEEIATKKKVPIFLFQPNHSDQLKIWIEQKNPDVIYCFGWSHILPKEILDIPPLGVVGYHPAHLPKNRGRHPIIWALALGLSETASTFFFMDEGADSGDILNQVVVPITEKETALSLYEKLAVVSKKQIVEFTTQLRNNTFTRVPQINSKSNLWRKRSKKDGAIDWRMSMNSIFNLVRALGRPYPGAHCNWKDSEFKIWQAIPVHAVELKNIEPGKVLESTNNELLIKCGDGAIRVTEHELPNTIKAGDYL